MHAHVHTQRHTRTHTNTHTHTHTHTHRVHSPPNILYSPCTQSHQIVQANLAQYVKYVTGLGSQFQYIIIVVLVFSIVSLPFWQLVIVKFGKKTAYFIGAWVSSHEKVCVCVCVCVCVRVCVCGCVWVCGCGWVCTYNFDSFT